jgi:hypothetical protein
MMVHLLRKRVWGRRIVGTICKSHANSAGAAVVKGRNGLCHAIRLIVAANLRFAVKIQDIGKPEARRHEIRSKASAT